MSLPFKTMPNSASKAHSGQQLHSQEMQFQRHGQRAKHHRNAHQAQSRHDHGPMGFPKMSPSKRAELWGRKMVGSPSSLSWRFSVGLVGKMWIKAVHQAITSWDLVDLQWQVPVSCKTCWLNEKYIVSSPSERRYVCVCEYFSAAEFLYKSCVSQNGTCRHVLNLWNPWESHVGNKQSSGLVVNNEM